VTILGFYVFTGLVSNSKLNKIITFCYIFTIVALAASILPWSAPSLFSGPPLKAPFGVLRGCAVATKTNTAIPGDVLCETGNNPQNYQWVINIGGLIAAQQPASGGGAEALQEVTSQIRGGVVVPLYVIVLALFGSAVSMTRRVPEYQRRAMDSQDPLTNVQARENLVFQIMQVLSAPLIAITVYYIIKPDTPMTSVILGFGSGFASEPILLLIRSLVEKLSPAKTAEPSLITVRVNPAAVILQPSQAQQFTAKVLGSPNSEVTWQTDPSDGSAGTISQSGYYVAPGSSPEKTVTVIASSAADRTKSGSASVTVKSIPSSSITVTVNPASVTLKSEQAQQFSAQVSGLPNSAVTWSIDPSDVENGGTISPNGKYVAPKTTTEKTVTITARSAADPTKSGSAKATVEP
jgi:hypothetical protein